MRMWAPNPFRFLPGGEEEKKNSSTWEKWADIIQLSERHSFKANRNSHVKREYVWRVFRDSNQVWNQLHSRDSKDFNRNLKSSSTNIWNYVRSVNLSPFAPQQWRVEKVEVTQFVFWGVWTKFIRSTVVVHQICMKTCIQTVSCSITFTPLMKIKIGCMWIISLIAHLTLIGKRSRKEHWKGCWSSKMFA